VALGFTIKLVERLLVVWEEALEKTVSDPKETLMRKMMNFQVSFVGRYSNHHPGP
jgi:hypothetical protein